MALAVNYIPFGFSLYITIITMQIAASGILYNPNHPSSYQVSEQIMFGTFEH